ncbi:MAG: substrate-binding domain-containing protein [Acidimicrobiia bacterium]|nr:substrate-binding domain-containing protein [Acidimicrobiia bacterium]
MKTFSFSKARLVRAAMAVAAVAVFGLVLPTGAASAAVSVDGAGSTWSQIAVDQWRADVARQGLSINYQGLGASTGRTFYIEGQTDFAVSEIPFQPASYDRDGNKLYDEVSRAAKRPYAYLPLTAGGTAFMYHLDVNGKRVTDLKLSGRTLAKIFTGKITSWDDPAITADDGRKFPHIDITPVLRSDGSATSYQLSNYLAKQFPDVWGPFCTAATHLQSPCPPTSLYPYFSNSRAQQGSDGVANYVAAPYNNGSIDYAEYGYALQRSFPVVSVLNKAGYYVQPTASNVAIALQKARINSDRTQVLDDVYNNPDPRSYPVSSYGYMIAPTTTASPFSADKGAVLGKFILYSVCAGQQKSVQLGYSPLPRNLVQFAFDAEKLIPGAPAPPAMSQCANPAVTGSFTTTNAPLPPASAKQGAQGPAASSTNPGSTNNSVTGGHTTSTLATRGSKAAGKGGGSSSETAAGPADGGSNVAVVAAPTLIGTGHDRVAMGVYVAAGLIVVLAIFLPPLAWSFLRRRDTRRASG